MRNVFGTAIWMLAMTTAACAAALEFDFKDPKGVNTVYFVLDSELEPIMGLASGLSGRVTFDPDDPRKTRGEIRIDAKTLHTQNKGMTDTLHGQDWLDVATHPTISFTFKNVKDSTSAGATHTMTVVGDLSCKGVTKEITVPVRATYQKGRLGDRQQGASGDLLVLRSEFTINRSDFGIKPGMPGAVVAEEIQVRVSIVGACPR